MCIGQPHDLRAGTWVYRDRVAVPTLQPLPMLRGGDGLLCIDQNRLNWKLADRFPFPWAERPQGCAWAGFLLYRASFPHRPKGGRVRSIPRLENLSMMR